MQTKNNNSTSTTATDAQRTPRADRGTPGSPMQAAVRYRYGDVDAVHVDTIATPHAGKGEVVIRVHAAAVDRGVWHLMTGLPYPVRLAGFGVRAPKNPVLGREVAGVITQVGDGVTDWHVGNEVFGVAEGAFAEFARARADKIAAKPSLVSFEQAAATTISALTALQAVRDHGHVTSGQRVLVIGASGGVGSFAVQIAKALGAEVTGVASTSKLELIRSIGADHVIDYTVTDISGERYDVIIDTGGNRPLKTLRSALVPNGRLVIVGGETSGRLLGGTGRQIRATVLSKFMSQTLGSFINSENSADLQALGELLASGAIKPAIDRTYRLAETTAAIRYLEDGHTRGKVVIAVPGDAVDHSRAEA